jgi:hypothetical protein
MKPDPLVSLSSRLTGRTGRLRARTITVGDCALSVTADRVRCPLPQDAPILSSLRPKSFCFPLLAAKRHAKPPASLLSTQRHVAIDEQLGEHALRLWTRALLRLPDAMVVRKASGDQCPEHPRSRRLHKKHLTVEPRLQPLSTPKRASPSYEATRSSSPT